MCSRANPLYQPWSASRSVSVARSVCRSPPSGSVVTSTACFIIVKRGGASDWSSLPALPGSVTVWIGSPSRSALSSLSFHE